MKSWQIVFVMVLTCFLACTVHRENNIQGDSGPDFIQNDSMPYLVVFSMDGFRWDYPDSFPTPNFKKIEMQGVRAHSMVPCFPTVTFPNHYTLATGLYPEHHGIVHNIFYDAALNITYSPADGKITGDARFYGGEPIWITAQKQYMKTANFFWIGSNAPIEGMYPTYWEKYNSTATFEQRIDTVIHWLSLPAPVRPHLVMLYVEEPDKTGHSYGPFSAPTRAMVMHLDSLLGDLISRAQALPEGNRINFIITSDHGMCTVKENSEIFLDRFIKPSWYSRVTGGSPSIMIDPEPGYTDSILFHLSNVPHLSVWKKSGVPQRLHFSSNPRIGQLVLLADSAYLMVWSDAVKEAGAHGYDNRNTDMHAIFYAMGPAFQNGTFPSFENENFYAMMAYILKLTPVTTDGDLRKVRQMLK